MPFTSSFEAGVFSNQPLSESDEIFAKLKRDFEASGAKIPSFDDPATGPNPPNELCRFVVVNNAPFCNSGIMQVVVIFTYLDGTSFTVQDTNANIPYPRSVVYRNNDTKECVQHIRFVSLVVNHGKLEGWKLDYQCTDKTKCIIECEAIFHC